MRSGTGDFRREMEPKGPREGNDMEHAQHPPARRIARAPVRRYSGALLLLAISSLFIACGRSDFTGPVVTTTPNAATLTWDAVTDPNLLGYRAYYGTAPGTYIQSFGNGLDVGSVPTTTLTGLTSGMRYYFAVTAVDTSTPQRESTYSNEVSAIIR
ncbi:MAG: hypothetical protein E6H75_15510 [Betaproteobacteria bacterium]|nr:MAG: hypothetical protein E6H75_15510 [Betaproteobacteria bacterium]